MSELKSCPFCGGDVRYEVMMDGAYSFACPDCGLNARFPECFTDREASTRIWNTRAERTCENTSMKSDQWLCSECGGNYDIANIDLDPDEDIGIPNYCPNCGAKVSE